MTKIGSNIKKVRTAKGLSQQSFADIFELTRGNISSYEESRAEPRIETVVRIANYFCIPLSDFITKSLTINEILQFNSDKLMEEEKQVDAFQLHTVPFISDNVYSKGIHESLSFFEQDSFPQLILPQTGTNKLLALTFNNNIPHPIGLPHYQMHDVLVFEAVTEENIHLCDGQTGLYISTNDLMIGIYEIKETQVDLVLNTFKKQAHSFKKKNHFYKLFAVYSHV